MTDQGRKPLTHGSLFSGIGGFDLGFQRAGIKTVWQVEIDPFCRAVLAKRFPQAERFEDVRQAGENLKHVDIITGGFPCQPHSHAGRRRGSDDSRWLWPEYQRIIRLLRPRFAVVENVPGLLTSGFGIVLAGLAEIGYDAEWQSISAASFGAKHLRERVWIVAYPASWENRRVFQSGLFSNPGRESEALADSKHDGPHQSQTDAPEQSGHKPQDGVSFGGDSIRHAPGKGLPDWAGGTMGQPQPLTEFERPSGREVERDFRGVTHGVSRRVDRLKSLGNAIVPQIAEWIGKRIVAYENGEAQ